MKDFTIIKFLLLLLLILTLAFFFKNAKAQPIATKKPTLEYTETNIEGCQYLVCRTYMGFETLCHKGNCTNHVVFKHSLEMYGDHGILAFPFPSYHFDMTNHFNLGITNP